ncbi:MAG TPA: NTP transferase domain-containing protein [Stellaceae bacterium]|nr:NTP transferase domain-containing protein [Stellaceae bacterium]
MVCISQARLNSYRLPSKVLKPILGKPMLWWHLARLKQARLVDKVMLAVADEPNAHLLTDIADELGIGWVRGSETDVLERFRLAVGKADAGTVIRVTSDCPVIDPVLIDETVARFAASHHPNPDAGGRPLDYLSIDIARLPRGLDVEALTRAQFDLAAAQAQEKPDREHVTYFVWRQPERFAVGHWAPDSADFGHLRLCVDTPEDFALVAEIYARALGPIDASRQSLPEGWCFGWRRAVELAAALRA